MQKSRRSISNASYEISKTKAIRQQGGQIQILVFTLKLKFKMGF